ncbi:MAG: hypothetical protein AAGC68_07420 [Verrucomicrobiota bacterium]
MEYTVSTLSDKPDYAFREKLFSPWLGPEALQAHVDHMVENGMLPLYTEHEPDLGFREIYWTPNVRTYFEVRSNRTFDEFMEIAERNLEQGHPIATLQIDKAGGFSSVWLSSEGMEAAKPVLKSLGITAAQISL